jgi:hypothetical protein
MTMEDRSSRIAFPPVDRGGDPVGRFAPRILSWKSEPLGVLQLCPDIIIDAIEEAV